MTSVESSHGPRPTAWIVTRVLGEPSETWLHRQIVGFRRVSPHVVCWRRKNDATFSLGDIPLHLQSFDPQPDQGRGRWLFRLRNAPGGNYFGSVGAEFRSIDRAMRETRPQVVLCHFGHNALRMLPVALRHDVPLVAHFHGLDVSSSLRNRWYRKSLLRMLPHFAAIVVVGSHQRQWMLEQGVDAERVHLIPCGVPTAGFSARPTGSDAPTRPASDPLQFICVSRLVEWKGVAECLRAFGRLRERGVDARLQIVGDGPDRGRLETLARELRLGESVAFRGSLAPDRVHELLCQSDVFLQHSLTDPSGWVEGFGVSIAEAASVGLPVIATRSGGIPDQVLDGGTGLLVAERDIAAMTDAMHRLARDPELRSRLGAAGRRRMVDHFDTELQIAKLEDVMVQAMRSARRPSPEGDRRNLEPRPGNMAPAQG